MSIYDDAMSNSTSSGISRRLFTKRVFGALAATTALGLGSQAVAQETGFQSSEPAVPQAEVQDSVSEAPVRSGQYIVDFAMAYVGYPYVWAGNGPGGFDCSGFTQYVILNTVGIDIGHGTAGQMNYGYWVDAANLLPGDLVYFAGTYGSGISHTGVYIGDGQFVHAENPGTGVTVSWLWSDYYGGHYAGAIRHW